MTISKISFSLCGNEICSQRPSRNVHRHTPSVYHIVTQLRFVSNFLQTLVSLRRIEKYLHSAEITAVPPLVDRPQVIAFQSATFTWPQDRRQGSSNTSAIPSAASTPRHKFILMDLTLSFPVGKLSFVCGKLGSGKTLLLSGRQLLRTALHRCRY
jgi:ABC-type multidrug transport system fused ATPase/permease subunit